MVMHPIHIVRPKRTRMNIELLPFLLPHPHIIPLGRLSSSLSLGTSDLGRLISLDGPLALADSRSAGNGVFAEVGAIVTLGGAADDGGKGLAG